MVEVISGRVPVGTLVGEAQRLMEREGFDCYPTTNGSFQDRRGLNYIYCDRHENIVIQRRWQVALVHRDGRVVEVLASTGLIGP